MAAMRTVSRHSIHSEGHVMGQHFNNSRIGTGLRRHGLRTLLCAAVLGFTGVAIADATTLESATIRHDVQIAEQATRSISIVGIAQAADGTPIADAVIVSAAGGKAVSDSDGAFELSVHVPDDTQTIGVTAVASIGGVNHVGNRPVSISSVDRRGRTHLGAVVMHANADCEPSWVPTFGGEPGVNINVRAFAVFDDGSGSGPALYVGGFFSSAGGVAARCIAKWDGAEWSLLGSGMMHHVLALTVFDDGSGSGPALYAGGLFTSAGGVAANRVAKWDGVQWSPLGGGTNAPVWALTVFDDGSGSGPALYAGGSFTSAGGVAANRVAKWDGVEWSPLGNGLGSFEVLALTVFDDGNGPALYAGGTFSTAGEVEASRIAKWDGTMWSPLGSGMGGGANPLVHALAVFDDGGGSGPALYAGGQFTTAGGEEANNIAKWDGSTWAPLGSGTDEPVQVLRVFDGGSEGGSALYAGGFFTVAGGVEANQIAKWDGDAWSALGSGMSGRVDALTAFDDGGGDGPVLFVGGDFQNAGGLPVRSMATWDGDEWSALTGGLNDRVEAWTVFDDGSGDGSALYAGGMFRTAGGVLVDRIAKWNGAEWSPLGSGMAGANPGVRALTVFDDGSGTGPALYAGGTFTIAGGVEVNRIAKWDGAEWSSLGGGMDGRVEALTVFDDGSGDGPALYAGGVFTTAGGVKTDRIAKWDGAQWSPLGSGMDGGSPPDDPSVLALLVFDDGSGPALYAGGNFTIAGGVSANFIAKWDGAEWLPLGSGVDDLYASVRALTVFDDGNGPALYAGGTFTTAGGVAANRIAKWDGIEWSPLGSGFNSMVSDLAVFDDGSGAGPELYAGGLFTSAGGLAASRIAKWDGTSWSPLGSGMNDWVVALTTFDDGSGPALYAGGRFTVSPAGDSYIAKWQGCPTETEGVLGDLNGDDIVDGADLGILLSSWGPCADPNDCPADLNGDGTVDGADLGILLSEWSN